jgi:cyclopropane-fatty-acyl-phospholipid synthase
MIIPLSLIKKHWFAALETIECGSIRFTGPDGKVQTFTGAQAGPAADFTIQDWDVLRRLVARGDIALGEDYIAGRWDSTDIESLISFFLLNLSRFDGFAHGNVFNRIGFSIFNRVLRRNSKRGSKSNIKAHYDVGNDFYKLWLDDSMTYSSALYKTGATDLRTAQAAKYGRILNRIENTGGSVLEIGCGWGGFAEEAANQNQSVTALTVSKAQHDYATRRLDGRANILLQDYRDNGGLYDNIVSIEMFEAVGEKFWPSFFSTVNQRLKRGGKAVVQTITIADEHFADYRKRSDFIRHYVFPGGMLPSVGRFKDVAAQAGMACTDVFSFGHDYARTLREWGERFEQQKQNIVALGHSEAFIRTWRFYLAMCAAAFAVGRTDVVQIELAHAS